MPQERQNFADALLSAPQEGQLADVCMDADCAAASVISVPHDRQNLAEALLSAPQAWQCLDVGILLTPRFVDSPYLRQS